MQRKHRRPARLARPIPQQRPKVDGEALQKAIGEKVCLMAVHVVLLSDEIAKRRVLGGDIQALSETVGDFQRMIPHLMELLKAGGDSAYVDEIQQFVDNAPHLVTDYLLGSSWPVDLDSFTGKLDTLN